MMDRTSVFGNMQIIQDEYFDILTVINQELTKENLEFYIDDITNFWMKRANKIEMIIDWLIKDGFNISYFTCATRIDVDSFDYYPFLLYGEYHIFDDPLVTHMTVSNLKNDDFANLMYDKAKLLIEDNLKVLEDLKSVIWVLPVRLLYSSIDKIDSLIDKANEYFLSLFNEVESIERYFELCKTGNDIDKLLIKDYKNTICLTEYETPKTTFVEKIGLLSKDKDISVIKFNDDAHLFYFQMHSFILQALDVVFTSSSARMVPFIRYRPSFVNYQMINQIFVNESDELSIIGAKAVVHHLLYRRFDFTDLKESSADDFLKQRYEIAIDFKDSISKLRVNRQPNFKLISSLVDDCLERYNKLYE